jgi:hypothetical protein
LASGSHRNRSKKGLHQLLSTCEVSQACPSSTSRFLASSRLNVIIHFSLICYYINNECNPKLRLVGIHICQQFNRQCCKRFPLSLSLQHFMYGYAKKASLINEIAETALLQIDLLLSFRGYLWALVVCMFPCKEKGKNWSILIFGFGDKLFCRCHFLGDIFSSIIYRSDTVVNFCVQFWFFTGSCRMK